MRFLVKINSSNDNKFSTPPDKNLKSLSPIRNNFNNFKLLIVGGNVRIKLPVQSNIRKLLQLLTCVGNSTMRLYDIVNFCNCFKTSMFSGSRVNLLLLTLSSTRACKLGNNHLGITVILFPDIRNAVKCWHCNANEHIIMDLGIAVKFCHKTSISPVP